MDRPKRRKREVLAVIDEAGAAMTDEQRGIILHALGLTHRKSKRARGYRNYYMSSPEPGLEAMRDAGWLVRHNPTEYLPDFTYRVTKRGLAAAGITARILDGDIAARMPE